MKLRGVSYSKRVADINRMYDQYARSGLSNREIWRRYIHPAFGISERTFYNTMNAAAKIGSVSTAAFDSPRLFDPDEGKTV